jgi:hypothetical protein
VLLLFIQLTVFLRNLTFRTFLLKLKAIQFHSGTTDLIWLWGYWRWKKGLESFYMRFSLSLFPPPKLLTYVLAAFKTCRQSYCDTRYSREGVNQMWIVENSKNLLEQIELRSNNIIYYIWLLYPLHNYSLLKTKRQIKQISSTLFH